MSATKNINAEKIQGSLTADTINIQTLGSGTSVTNLGIDSNGNVVTGTTGGGGDNFYVTGFTYNDANTFTISQNGGLGDLTSTINNVTGLTVNGNLDIIGDINVTGTTYYTNITGTSIGVDYIDFNNALTPLPADQEGRIYWDEDNGTLSLGMHGGQVVQQIGLENYYYVKNQSGATIENGRVVRAAGTLGSSGRILGEYMIADGTIPAKYTLGIATEDIIDGDDGYVTEFGLVRGIDASGTLYGESWSGGTILYVSPTTPGGLTSVEPQAPDLKIEMAIVIDADANGSIFVRPTIYPHIYDLQEVNYTGGSENNLDILQWNSSNSTWDKTNTPSFSGLTMYGDITMDESALRYIKSSGPSETSRIKFGSSGSSVNMEWIGGGNNTIIDVNGTSFISVSSSKSSFGGIVYGADYSLNYDNRSLIDLGYFNSNDRYVTGFTYNDANTLTLSRSAGLSDLTTSINTLTGLTINGNLDVTGDIGNTGNCVTNLYVSNIQSCSPLNINSNDEGNVYFGSTSGVTIDVVNSKLGIGVSNPTFNLDVVQGSSSFYTELDNANGPISVTKTTNTNNLVRLAATDGINSINIGVVGSTWTGSTGFGAQTDSYIYSNSAANGLNIINQTGVGTEDYIRFYAGGNALNTASIHIDGSGSTKGNVGIGTETPTDILEVVQNTEKFSVDLDNASGPLIKVSTTDTNNLIRFGASDGTSSINMGTVGSTWTGSTELGVPSDSYIYSNSAANGLNIISRTGVGTEDYIRFYAGGNASTSTASIHIDGDGVNKGWVGIGTESPQNPLHIYSSGSTYVSKIESGVSETKIRFKGSSTTNEPWIGSSGNKFQIGHVTSGETLTVTETGNVGVGTDVPEETLTVLGSFNLREYGTITGPTSTAGWYRLGYTSGSDRGGIRVVISYIGASWTPVTYVINAFKNWTDVSSLSLEKYGSINYITEARIVEDEIDSTTYHLEVYLTSWGVGHSANVYLDKNLGYEGTWNLNTGSLSASTSTATPIARSPFTSTNGGYTLENLIINDNVNNQFWRFEDTSGSLEIKDWNSDNLITFDGVNDRIGIGTTTPSESLDVVGNTTISGTLNIGTIGGGTPVGNLGFDSNGQVVTGTTAGGDSNSTVENFYYSISNSVDTRPIFEDTNVLFNWDETGNDLEFQMKVAPGGSGDMRSLAYLVGGSTQNTAIVSTGVNYDVYAAGVSAGNRLEVFITAENDVTYPAYHVTVYNTGESFENTVWIQRITRN